jgi:signal transduction histidine kinase
MREPSCACRQNVDPDSGHTNELEQLRRIHASAVMTASLLHDLRNLLTPIVTLSATLEAECRPETPEARLAGELRMMSERATAIVHDIVTIARPRTSATRTVKLSPLIRELKPMLERFVGDGIELELSLHDSDNEVALDIERFEHAMVNLIANGRDAMPGGGVLTISTQDVTLADVTYARVIISDTGLGISDEIRSRIFDPFFTTKASLGGTGLGLPSVRRFVEESGGMISVASQPGKGTLLVLCFPTITRADVESTST